MGLTISPAFNLLNSELQAWIAMYNFRILFVTLLVCLFVLWYWRLDPNILCKCSHWATPSVQGALDHCVMDARVSGRGQGQAGFNPPSVVTISPVDGLSVALRGT